MNTLTIDGWLLSILTADGTIAAFVGDRVYGDQAPEDVAFPFILFGLIGEATDVMGVGATRIQTNAPYLVRVVAKTENYDDLKDVADRIDYLIHGRSAYAVETGKNVLSAVREGEFRLAEKDAGVEIRHLGGRYTVAAQ